MQTTSSDYNDLFRHLMGDECLQSLARVIGETVPRSEGTVARFGGEEFAVILADADAQYGRRVAEDIRLAVFQMGQPHPSSPLGVQSVSLGVASLTPNGRISATDLIAKADRALYRAKDLGRNQVVVA